MFICKANQITLTMDEHETVIIDRLKRDSRTSLADVSRELDVTTTQVMDKLGKLEKQYLKGYTVVLDYPAMGYHCMAVLVKLKDGEHHLIEHLKEHEAVTNIATVAGQYDVLFESVHGDSETAYEFLQGLQDSFEIETIDMLPQLNMVSREGHHL